MFFSDIFLHFKRLIITQRFFYTDGIIPKKDRLSLVSFVQCSLFNWCLEQSNRSGQWWLFSQKLDSFLPSALLPNNFLPSLLPKETPATKINTWDQKKCTWIGFQVTKDIPSHSILKMVDIQYAIVHISLRIVLLTQGKLWLDFQYQ